MSRLFRRRRLCTLLLLIAGAASIFLIFQVFSIGVLSGLSSSDDVRNVLDHDAKITGHAPRPRHTDKNLQDHHIDAVVDHDSPFLDKIDKSRYNLRHSNCTGDKCDIQQKLPDLKDIRSKKQTYDLKVKRLRSRSPKPPVVESQKLEIQDHVESKAERNADVNVAAERVHGVSPHQVDLYRADQHGMFTCLDVKERIPFWQVNDDYCDCMDGSDEPGTSACTNSRFYCTFQLDSALVWVSSSKVQDGICDCCDGSDEVNGPELPSHVQLDPKHKYYSIYQSPCQDRCGELRREKQATLVLQQKGRLLRQRYLDAGKGQHNKLYGAGGVFFLLSQSCYSAKIDHYTYTVCPFTKAEQASKSSHSHKTHLGSDVRWLSRSMLEGYKLVLDGGDKIGCPNKRHRKTMVSFLCGLEDRLLTIQEDEVCTYVAVISTPVACA